MGPNKKMTSGMLIILLSNGHVTYKYSGRKFISFFNMYNL